MMLAIVLGTRPEIIKCSPVIHEARRRGLPFSIIHTGQHYTPELDELFFSELDLPQPTHNLHVGSRPPAKQVAAMLEGLCDVFDEVKPDVVMVQGDTNSVLAGSLCAHKMNIPVAHLEAGLRSDDWDMPEEGNRVLTGVVADYHFCPTELQRERLAQENISQGVHVVGNTIVDASLYYAGIARSQSQIRERLGISNQKHALLTMHRPSNVDEPARLSQIMSCLDTAAKQLDLRIIFPVHPRTENALKTANLWKKYENGSSFIFTKPIGYLDLLRLQVDAQLVLTDSGGIQEEANILRVPCVTLRANTERPETLEAGSSVLYSGVNPADLTRLAQEMMAKDRNWDCPFGDGKTAQRVIEILSKDL
ncbi:UDP-N-acetylglucosamine 2-epimerase (non-hydrolyzing) [Patescibacteria group bacterium]|nr:UDP-N-acetylglucosamine 2-epimerase (non-hydrolyzing) [Patescibacteria group bacterium]